MTWTTAALGDVCDIVSGATPRTSEKAFWGGNILWTTPKDLSDLDGPYLEAPPRTITEEGLKSCAASLLPKNSVLLSSRAPIGLVAINSSPMATNQGFKSLVPDSRRVDSKFLFHWLKSKTAFLQSLGNGATFKEISKAVVERIEIPLPPLDEQRRIAAILDKADDLRRKRKRALELIDGLTRAVFESIESKVDWPRIPFSEAVYFQEGPGIRNWQFRDSGIKLVNVRNIVGGILNTENTSRYLSEEEVANRYTHFLLEAGDFVLASSGVTWGKIAEVQSDDLPLCLNTSMIRIRPRSPFSRAYVRSFIEFGDFRSQIDRLITGSAQPNFGPSHLKQVLIPMMSNEMQDTLERLSIRVGSVRRAAATMASVSDNFFSSLQSRAFSGQL